MAKQQQELCLSLVLHSTSQLLNPDRKISYTTSLSSLRLRPLQSRTPPDSIKSIRHFYFNWKTPNLQVKITHNQFSKHIFCVCLVNPTKYDKINLGSNDSSRTKQLQTCASSMYSSTGICSPLNRLSPTIFQPNIKQTHTTAHHQSLHHPR